MEDTLILVLTAVGIAFLLISIIRSVKITRILRVNVYEWRLWIGILVLLLGFILGYIVLILNQFGKMRSPISLPLVVALVYFFGAIFTVYTTGTVERNLVNILGETMTTEEAILRFREYAGLPDSFTNHIDRQFELECDYCDRPVYYSIPDIVRANVVALDRGIAVEDIFGTKSYILRPSHRCIKGRREITVVHDKNLELRSIEGSRLIYGGKIS